MEIERLFASLDVGGKLRLPNRLVMAPMTTISGELDGSFSDQEIAYLAQRARHGVGLVMTPACYVHKSGHAFERQVGCHSDEMLPGLTRCAEAINREGAASFLQVHHGGNAARSEYTGQPTLAPSAVANRRGTSELPKGMTVDEIETIVEAFAAAAGRAKKAGFTGIEIHGANTYLFQQFFSRYTNKRDDKYGARTMENRCRFASEVVKAVRETVGPEYPVAYRLSPEEEDPDGYSTYDAIELLERIVPLGIDIVHVSSWEYGKGVRNDYPAGSHPTLLIREAIDKSVPVIGVGSIFSPEEALRVLDDGVELVALGRALLLNHHWPELVKNGRADEIRTELRSEAEREALEIPRRMVEYSRRFFEIEA